MSLEMGAEFRPTLRDKPILVVEDDPTLAMLWEVVLTSEGARVVGPAASVTEALRLIEGSASGGGLSAAVLDFSLAGEVVIPVADRLAELGVPFLFATAYGDACDRGQHAGAPVLRKPLDLQVFTAAVDALACR